MEAVDCVDVASDLMGKEILTSVVSLRNQVQHLGLAKERGKAVVCHSKAGAEICEVAGSEDQPRFRKARY